MSLKPSLIGRDADKNEYWFFKEDLTKIYIKFFETQKWGQFEDELSVSILEQSLSIKGMKERKLQEAIKRIKGKMRYRRKKEAPVEMETVSIGSNGEDVKIFGQDESMAPVTEDSGINWDDHLQRALCFNRKKKTDVGT